MNNSGAVGPKGEGWESLGSFPKYPEYKRTPIEWLDEVPSHWRRSPIKYMALSSDSLFIDGDWIESKDIAGEGIKYITTGNVGEGVYKEQGSGFISDQTFRELNCTSVLVGDVLISRLNSPIGRACVVPNLGGEVVTSVDNVILRADPLFCRKYLVYLFSSQEYFSHTGNLARGTTMQRISRSLLGNIRAEIPPLKEQTQIARFLDHETARIDALIEEQQRLIELLKEKRQTVISHAVTKGLDPNVPMKDSGVEWLGEVPEHWRIVRMRFLCRITTGDKDTQDAEPGGKYPFFVRSDTIEHSNSYSFAGEGVFTSGDGAGVGKIFHHFEGKCAVHQRVYLFHSFSGVTGKFFFHYLKSKLEPVVLSQSAKSTVDSLRLPMLQNFWMTSPPLSEQEKICSFIKRFELETVKLLEEGRRFISLLKERRSALISAAVTGKIDVRNWQPAQPNATDSDDYAMVAEPAGEYN